MWESELKVFQGSDNGINLGNGLCLPNKSSKWKNVLSPAGFYIISIHQISLVMKQLFNYANISADNTKHKCR